MAMSNSLSQIHKQIMWNRLIAVVEEQAQTLLRTAFSIIVREAGDLSAGVFDLQGRMLAQAVTGTPGHVNSMAESVKHFVRHFPIDTMREGDIYITNDPWMGTGHTNDFVLTTPAQMAHAESDPLWPMPLWQGYDDELSSKVADLNNVSSSSFAGAITAALFLRRFVSHARHWLHLDLYAWNGKDRPGRPVGAEPQCIRALYAFLKARYPR